MAKLEVLLRQRKGLGVPKHAVIERAGKPVVFTVENGIAHMVAVRTDLETEGWVELVGGTLPEDSPVVTMGQFMLNEGSPVSVQNGRL